MRSKSIAGLRNMDVLSFLTAFFFVLTFVIKAFVDGPFGRGEVSSTVAYTKYFTALVSCLTGVACIARRGERLFVREFNLLMIVFLVFTLGSVVCQLISGVFSLTVYVELMKFAMPIVLAYIVLNSLSRDEVYVCMVFILMVSIAGYCFELRDSGAELASFFQADFSTSSSDTESSLFSGIALVLALYFMYFDKSKTMILVSVVFSLLTFKRLAMLVALAALALYLFAPRLMRAHVSRGFIVVCKIATLIGALAYFWILLPEQHVLFYSLFSQSQSDFTMGRSMVMDFLMHGGFHSYGFGSANETAIAIFGAPFEMDLIKIAFELTPFATVLFVWLFWDVAGNSFWGFFIVSFYMLNMITSDSLTSNFAFTLAYMVLGLVNSGFDAEEFRKALNSGREVSSEFVPGRS